MSLDVYLKFSDNDRGDTSTKSRICIREGGRIREISRAEWDERFPEREPVTVEVHDGNTAYHANITHNLTAMAEEAKIYGYLWTPGELGITKAAALISPLRAGLTLLLSLPKHFKTFNPENGWGDYEGFVEFVSDYLAACEEFPDADVSVWT